MAGDDHESSDMNAQLYFHGIKLTLGASGIVWLKRAREGRGTIRCPGATTDTKIDGHPRHTRRTHMLKCDGAPKPLVASMTRVYPPSCCRPRFGNCGVPHRRHTGGGEQPQPQQIATLVECASTHFLVACPERG